jgi:hypothetical protein
MGVRGHPVVFAAISRLRHIGRGGTLDHTKSNSSETVCDECTRYPFMVVLRIIPNDSQLSGLDLHRALQCSQCLYTRRHEQIQISYHQRRLQAKSEHASKGAIVTWLQSCFLSSVTLTRSRKLNPLIDTTLAAVIDTCGPPHLNLVEHSIPTCS